MITIVDPFYIYFNRKIKSLRSLGKPACKRKMLFWTQEVLGGQVIALDTAKRKLLYLSQINSKPSCLIINLKDIDRCSVKKQYNSIHAGGLLKKKLQDYLKNVCLRLWFKNSSQSIALPFYEEQNGNDEDAAHLEVKAKEWETMVSKLLTRQLIERA